MNFICLDGKLVSSDTPVLYADNRGFRYGDGLFETMKIIGGRISLEQYHFDRLFRSLTLLQFDLPALFSREMLHEKIIELCRMNQCDRLGRVRLTIYRGNGGLYEDIPTTNYLIESRPLADDLNSLNENGLAIDVYPFAAKATDLFSNLKSASFQSYAMAALYAKANKLNECLVLNVKGNIADGSITNVFMVRDGTIFTPPLSEGCIDGVMRRYLIEKLTDAGYDLREIPLKPDDLLQGDEVFLSNAIQGIKWISTFREKYYVNGYAQEIFRKILRPLFEYR